MTDLIITEFGDTWINAAAGKTTTNYGSSNGIDVRISLRRGLLLPPLPNLAGRTVLSATLVGHARVALVSQTHSLAPITEKWSPGKATWETPSNGGPTAGSTSATASPGAVAAGGVVQWTVTDDIQAVADGTPWFGWRLGTNSATVDQRFQATDSGEPAWELHITLSDSPDQPTDLRPDGGGNITDTTPILSWVFDDGGIDSTSQAQSQVQVDKPTGGADPDEVAPDFDSGWDVNITPQLDLTGQYTLVGAGPHYWRVRVQDGDGNISDWSDWATFGVATKPTLVVDSPTGAFGDPTPTLAAHLSSGSVSSWFARVTGPDRSDIRARSNERTGAIAWTIPLKGPDGRRVLKDDDPGWIYLRVYPTGNWTTSVGETPYVETWIQATWDAGAATNPTALTASQIAPGDPRLEWEWHRTEDADAWVAQVDGVTIARIDPADVAVSAGTYTWIDAGQVAPLRPQTLGIRAIEGVDRTAAATLSNWKHTVDGLWLIPEADGIDPIQLDGTGVGGFARTDYRATYVTATGDEVDILYGTPGRSANFEGSIDSRDDGDTALWAKVAALEALRVSSNRMARLVWGSQSATVRLRDVDVTPADDIDDLNLLHVVRFGFVEVPG